MRLFTLIAASLLLAITGGASLMRSVSASDVNLSAEIRQGCKYPAFWPPRPGARFPDLRLAALDGRAINLSNFAGKVVLIEELAMSCPACNAFCGANKAGGKGGFSGVTGQPGMPAIDDYLRQQGIDTNNPNFVKVDLLLYNMNLQAPSIQEARAFCNHYNIAETKNHIVLIGDKSMLGQASYDLIPGFQLLDRSFVLCSDSSGHNPKDDLWRVLIPKLKSLL